jgi:hypothetical protein
MIFGWFSKCYGRAVAASTGAYVRLRWYMKKGPDINVNGKVFLVLNWAPRHKGTLVEV